MPGGIQYLSVMGRSSNLCGLVVILLGLIILLLTFLVIKM